MTDPKKSEPTLTNKGKTEFEKQVIKDEAEAELTHSKLTGKDVNPLNSTEARSADSVTTSSPDRGIPEPTGKNVSADNPIKDSPASSPISSERKDMSSSFTTPSTSNKPPFPPPLTPSLKGTNNPAAKNIMEKNKVQDGPRMELLKQMNEILENFGGETNVPVGHQYWSLRDQYRSMKPDSPKK